jgi:hypothetical protein
MSVLLYEEIKNRLNLGNAYCHSVQNLYHLLSKDEVTVSKIVILPVVLYVLVLAC